MSLMENLETVYDEKRRIESTSVEDDRIIAAKFPKLWDELRQQVEKDLAEYNHRFNGRVDFLKTGDQMFGAKRESYPGSFSTSVTPHHGSSTSSARPKESVKIALKITSM